MFNSNSFFGPIKERLNQIGLHLASILSSEAEQELLPPEKLEALLEFQELVSSAPLEHCKLLMNKNNQVIGYSFERNDRRYETWFDYYMLSGSGFFVPPPMRVFSLDVTELKCGHVVLELRDTPSSRSIFLRLEGRFEAEKNLKE